MTAFCHCFLRLAGVKSQRRCRAELGVAGRVCRHCRLEEVFLRWEGRLFSLYAKAGTGAGGRVTAEEALQKAQQAALDRAERGGLGEAGALPQDHPEDASLLLGARRRDGAVATTEIVRRPGETETALRLLLHQLKIMKLPAELATRKDLLVAAGRAHLELLESARKLYLKARAVTLAQRGKLYAYDELEMATMRIRLRAPGEVVTEIEELYKIYMEEIPIRSTELSGDKAAAEAELRRTLGTLRYLHGLRADRQRAGGVGSPPRLVQQGTQRLSHHGGQQAQHGEHGRQQGRQPAGIDPAQRLPRTAAGVAAEARAAASAAAADGCEDEGPVLSCALHHPALPSDARDAALGCQPGAAAVDGGTAEHVLDTQGGATEGERDMCPVCHDTLGEELSMLPCGHRLCCRCSVVLVERLPSGQPQASKRIHCPTCRVSVPVSDIAYVDAGGDVQQGKTCMEGDAAEEASIVVRGSYGTKLENVIRKVLWITSQDAAAKLLVFSTWRDVLELVAHALRTNNVPHLYPRDAKKFDASITEFKHSNDTNADKRNTLPAHAPRVLLLLVKQGGNGLNLTEAQHVIFVDPLLDPGLEAQAVGRVHRIGQAKETHIHRFVVRSTIEENVHRLCQQRAAAMDLSAAAILSRNLQKGLTVRDVALLLEDSFGAGVQEEGLSSPQRGRSLA